jgi:hypothetical protein
LEPVEKAEAKERQGQRTDLGHVGNFPQGSGKTRDKIGSFAGVSGRKVRRGLRAAHFVVETGAKRFDRNSSAP